MECCYSNECENYSVTPILLSPCPPIKCCESAPVYIPCQSSCNEKQVIFCCEKPPTSTPQAKKVCCDDQGNCLTKCQRCADAQQSYCPTCHQPTNPPVKTPVKYIMPCYRYEDGRIEQYVPKIHGRLPTTAYKRNGIQDQIVGYRGAMRYLCAVKSLQSSALRRNGLQDQKFVESGGISYIRQCRHVAFLTDSPFYMPIDPMKKLPSVLAKK
ncbi:uncharacterized protein [Battus philenor]|uniref:uncharacterized protein n=1 Tax=Battus philenor TaxID=42288 RepID=UPI0035D00C4B